MSPKDIGPHLQTLFPGIELANQDGMCLIFPMMESLGKNFRDGHGANIVVKIKEFNKTKTKEDQIALPSFKDIDVSR
jgi:hypothetical protein